MCAVLTHPLEEGVEDGERRGGLPGDVGEGAGGGQQRDEAGRAALRSQADAVEERPAVQLPMARHTSSPGGERPDGEREGDKRVGGIRGDEGEEQRGRERDRIQGRGWRRCGREREPEKTRD